MHNLDTNKITQLAKLILSDKINILEGCREVVRLCSHTKINEDPDILTIRGFDSETDIFPTGETRKLYNKEYLNKLDEELSHYLKEAEAPIKNACQQIINRYANNT